MKIFDFENIDSEEEFLEQMSKVNQKEEIIYQSNNDYESARDDASKYIRFPNFGF